MKNIRNLVVGFVIGLIFAVPVNAAIQEYNLKESYCKLVIDGIEYRDDALPILLLEPGYNYLPAALFRDVCGILQVKFEFDVPTKEIRIDTQNTSKAALPIPTPIPASKDSLTPFFSSNIIELLDHYGELTLIADDDEKTYLGKITYNEFESESVLNDIGRYGSDISRTSIWNDISSYGSDISRYSAFNDIASHPPIIYDSKGNKVGLLTTNNIRPRAVDPSGLIVLRKN